MIALPAFPFVDLLAVLALFQLALLLGTPWGSFMWGCEHNVLSSPLRMGSAISILLHAVFATVALDRSGIIAAYLLLSILAVLVAIS